MHKIKIILTYLLIFLLILVGVIFLKIKNKEERIRKAILAEETRKTLDHLMLDLRSARKSTFSDVPVDGEWHNHMAYIRNSQGPLEYDLRFRRQKKTPNILEVQIEAQNDVSIKSNLRIRIH